MSSRKESTDDGPPVESFNARFWAPLLLIFITLVVFLAGVQGDFVFDDLTQIVDNDRVQQPDRLSDLFRRSQRPLTDFTFWINARAGGTDPTGYHIINILIHVMAALVLFALVRLTVRRLPARFPINATWLAFFCALLWAVHPLQTQSVTYIVQRAESLAGLFYLLTVYAAARSMTTNHRRTMWWIIAILCCALGLLSKPVVVTAPLVVLLYDRCFPAGSFARALRARWPLYAGLAATWTLMLVTGTAQGVLSTAHEGAATVGFSYQGVTPMQYLLTQPGVILHYLHLSVWPLPLVLDYGWPIARTPQQYLPALLSVIVLGVLTVYLLWRKPRAGFVAAVFFIVLAPTSSFIPIKDLAFEHRMYLPLITVVVLAVLSMFRVLPWLAQRTGVSSAVLLRAACALLLVIAAGLSVRSMYRNAAYAQPWRLWDANVAQTPWNIRAYNQLAAELMAAANRTQPPSENLINRAERALLSAVALDDPDSAVDADTRDIATAHYLLGTYYMLRQQPVRAEPSFRRVIDLDPDHHRARYQLGRLLLEADRAEEALPHLRLARAAAPQDMQRQLLLGRAAAAAGDAATAIGAYKRAVELSGDDATILYEWSKYATEAGFPDGRLNALLRLLRTHPDNFAANFDIAQIYRQRGDPVRAAQHLSVAVRANPDSVPALINLGSALIEQNNEPSMTAAVGALQRAVQLQPDNPDAHVNLGIALARLDRGREAAASLRRALELQPDHPDAQTLLTEIERTIGRQ